MKPSLANALSTLASDRRSGATTLTSLAISILRDARRDGLEELRDVARGVCRAQPCMASIWNAAAVALASPDDENALERFAEQAARAPEQIGRLVADLVSLRAPGAARDHRIVTFSASGTVRACLRAVAATGELTVTCAEGRPAYEGRDMAAALFGDGVHVELLSDAGATSVVAEASAVMVGADAVSSRWLINKCGTAALAAAAAAAHVPVIVVAGSDKLTSSALAPWLRTRAGAAEEVWGDPPSGLAVRNPYFERVRLEWISQVVVETGVLAVDFLPQACEARARPAGEATLIGLLREHVD